MKILVLTSSAHTNGTTALLADRFCAGAEEAGHEIYRIDGGKMKIHTCIGCNHCREHGGKCVFDDDMSLVYPQLLAAEAVVFVTPLYYFGMTAKLKEIIDRFYAINETLREKPIRALLLSACGDSDQWAMDALLSHYNLICRYLHWEDRGSVLAFGCYTLADMEKTDYPQNAFDLGRGLEA